MIFARLVSVGRVRGLLLIEKGEQISKPLTLLQSANRVMDSDGKETTPLAARIEAHLEDEDEERSWRGVTYRVLIYPSRREFRENSNPFARYKAMSVDALCLYGTRISHFSFFCSFSERERSDRGFAEFPESILDIETLECLELGGTQCALRFAC